MKNCRIFFLWILGTFLFVLMTSQGLPAQKKVYSSLDDALSVFSKTIANEIKRVSPGPERVDPVIYGTHVRDNHTQWIINNNIEDSLYASISAEDTGRKVNIKKC